MAADFCMQMYITAEYSIQLYRKAVYCKELNNTADHCIQVYRQLSIAGKCTEICTEKLSPASS
jgi:hypothetical protein